ncbi:ABC transporter permease [Rhodococcoides kyotonense]|uniref:Peptide/nickel transport system permease protein n=1 Tax=Rhodococcoides kyotonense TaxID=398843 RepID=A0A239G8J9_9NOCA|nr:ABC transporter permease [Rhodococcus kyotonensis]SNS65401.1 peptide/nickel transport system permease protein [Rhodococcus kyotonensis]
MSHRSRYVLRRIVQAFSVVVLTYTFVFFVLNILPGNPIESRINSPENPISAKDAEVLTAYYNLDKSALEQFWISVSRLLHGDLGFSLTSGKSVTSLLASAIPQTAALALFAFVIAVVAAAGIALTAVFAPSSWLREFARGIPPIFLSVPSFIVGLVLLQIFSFQLGIVSAIADEGVASLWLPAVALAIPVSAPIAQVMIQGLATASAQPYVDILRSKGLREDRVIFGHIVKNGSIPTLTIAAITIGELLAGSVITETIFSRTGIGFLVEDAVRNQDLPIIQAIVILVSTVFVITNLIVDLVYPVIDPRISVASTREAVTA